MRSVLTVGLPKRRHTKQIALSPRTSLTAEEDSVWQGACMEKGRRQNLVCDKPGRHEG